LTQACAAKPTGSSIVFAKNNRTGYGFWCQVLREGGHFVV
jgi:hypothetical protein